MQSLAFERSVEETFVLNVHPGAIQTEATEKYGLKDDSMNWDDGKFRPSRQADETSGMRLASRQKIWYAVG